MHTYPFVLFVHAYVRWLVAILIVVMVARALTGVLKRRTWTDADERTHRVLVGAVDLQLLLGLWLYLVASPMTTVFFANPKASMHDTALRFFGVEHITAMVLAVVAIHAGRDLSKRAKTDASRHRRTFGWTLAAMLLVIIGIPWPERPYGRPLWRPIPSTASVSACPPSYGTRCATCHGELGHGDGLAAPSLKPPPRNFTDPNWLAGSDGDLAKIISEGGAAHRLSPAMPAHRDLTEAELAALVQCLRAFSTRR